MPTTETPITQSFAELIARRQMLAELREAFIHLKDEMYLHEHDIGYLQNSIISAIPSHNPKKVHCLCGVFFRVVGNRITFVEGEHIDPTTMIIEEF